MGSWRLSSPNVGRHQRGGFATRSRAFVHDDVVVCLLEHSLTKAEQNPVAAGEAEAVRRLRDVFQTAMETELVGIVERLTGHRVRAFVSGSNVSTDTSTEVFLPEAPNSAKDPERRYPLSRQGTWMPLRSPVPG